MDEPPRWLSVPEDAMGAAHLFLTGREDMEARIAEVIAHLARDGMIWVSWPK